MVKLKIVKIRAFTILETLVSLTIALTMFGLMVSLFEKINGNAYSVRKLKAHELLEVCVISMRETESNDMTDIHLGEFLIKRRFSIIDSLPGVQKWKIDIFDIQGRLVDQDAVFIQSRNEAEELQ